MNTVDLIIPTLDRIDLLGRCLDSLKKSSFTDFRLFVYDDGSVEDVASTVTSEFPDAIVVRSDASRGLAVGFNQCIQRGRSRYVVLLNNDTEVEASWLGALVECADRHPTCGSVASKIRLLEQPSRLHSAGDTYSNRCEAGNRGVWLDDAGQFDREDEVFGSCGAAALYRRTALDAVALPGGQYFDERLGMYFEDVELAWRLQLAGFPCVFSFNAVVYHQLSATGGGAFASYHVARNRLQILGTTVPRELTRRNWSRIVVRQLGIAAEALRHISEPAARATLRGIAAGATRLALGGLSRRSLPDAERERIERLLVERSSRRDRGVPIARLRQPADAGGAALVVGTQFGRPDLR